MVRARVAVLLVGLLPACGGDDVEVATEAEAKAALDAFGEGHVNLGYTLYQGSGEAEVGDVLPVSCLEGEGRATVEAIDAAAMEVALELDGCAWSGTSLTGALAMTIERVDDGVFGYAATGDVVVGAGEVEFALRSLAAGASGPRYCWEAIVEVAEGEVTLASSPDGVEPCREPIDG